MFLTYQELCFSTPLWTKKLRKPGRNVRTKIWTANVGICKGKYNHLKWNIANLKCWHCGRRSSVKRSCEWISLMSQSIYFFYDHVFAVQLLRHMCLKLFCWPVSTLTSPLPKAEIWDVSSNCHSADGHY